MAVVSERVDAEHLALLNFNRFREQRRSVVS